MKEFFSQFVYWHWFALAIFLAIMDVIFGANFLFVWCGISAALVGLIMLVIPSMVWEYQFLIFGIGVLASLVIWSKYLKNKPHPITDAPHLNQRGQQYINRIFTLEEPIVNGRGKVRVDDSIWRVEGDDMPVGSKVRVKAVDGVVLKVEKIN
jgi:membrane protein implicated in regulation of membrane protease activity